METSLIRRQFEEVGLRLDVAREPLAAVGGAEDIFMLDIRRRDRRDPRSERFVLWPGHPTNLVSVLGKDAAKHQLVLLIKEPSRPFLEPVPEQVLRRTERFSGRTVDLIASLGGVASTAVVRQQGRYFVRRVTPEGKRHVLAGRDERQLFLSQLPRGCSEVRSAHAALRPTDAEGAPGRAPPKRQGEWFFVTPSEAEILELATVPIHRQAGLGRFLRRPGKPHVADEVIVLGQGEEARVFARGAVKHSDHRTLHLQDWHRVILNREVPPQRNPASAIWIGPVWID